MIKKNLLLWIAALVACSSCSAKSAEASSKVENNKTEATAMAEPKDTNDVLVDIKTSVGDIQVRLYGETPRHRDNFVKLVKEGFYNDVLFHRIINQFMIQTGDPESKGAAKGKMLGSGGPGYNLPAEIVYPKYFHKRGALAAARQADQVNPKRESSGSQFYIVTGRVMPAGQLQQMEQQMLMAKKQDVFQGLVRENEAKIRQLQTSRDSTALEALRQELIAQMEAKVAGEAAPAMTEEQRQAYTTVGGAPHLDGQYTVFGEVVKGMEVVDKIEKVATDRNDRPVEDVKIISMSIVK